MYSLPDYGRMLGEPTRFGAYRRALERAVTGGEIVMDIGAGPGVLGLLAAQAGASRVYAVEPDPVVELAAKLARSNDLPQLEVVPQLSSTFSPENRADVLISDLRGVLPTFTEHLASIIDARDRLLKPGGTLIPRRDVLMACPVCAPEARRRHLGGFEVEGLDLEIARRRASHLWTRVELEKRAVASEPVQIAELDYRTITDPNVKGQASFELDGRPLDGIAVWFDADIDGEERFSNAPSSSLIYGQAFFPFDSSLETRAGDVLHLGFAAHYVAGDDYLYRWRGELLRDGERLTTFDQSTFHGTSIAPGAVASRSPAFRPKLSPRARIDSWILSRLSDGASLGEVATELVEREPELHSDPHRALRAVSALADRYAISE